MKFDKSITKGISDNKYKNSATPKDENERYMP